MSPGTDQTVRRKTSYGGTPAPSTEDPTGTVIIAVVVCFMFCGLGVFGNQLVKGKVTPGNAYKTQLEDGDVRMLGAAQPSTPSP